MSTSSLALDTVGFSTLSDIIYTARRMRRLIFENRSARKQSCCPRDGLTFIHLFCLTPQCSGQLLEEMG